MMVERICPECQHGNPLENRFCGACGAALEHNALVTRPAEGAIVIAGQRIPLAQARQLGRAMAVGLAAVAAEAGIGWAMRRVGQTAAPTTTALAARPTPQTPAQTAGPVAEVVTIISQRVVEIWDHGNLTRQIVEKHVWKKEG